MQYWIRASAGMLAATFLAAGQPAADKCRIEGTVLNAVTGQPIRKARITLTPVQGEPILVATDAHGKYALADLAPGKYSLLAGHDGYTDQRYGAKRPGEEQKGEQLELTAGSVKTDVDLKLTPLGAIMGFVRDEDGDPVRQVDVALLAYAYGPSGKKLRAVSNAQTDALGEYRLFDLLPGTYYLRAKPMSAQSPGTGQITEAYAAVFYPNSQPQSGAGAVELTAGQEQRGIDFVLHQIPVSFIRGRIVPPVGGAHCLATLEAGADELQPSSFGDVIGSVSFGTFVSISDNGEMGVAASGIRPAGNDNRFEFHNVPLGNHTLGGRCAVGKQQFTTKMPIQLDAGGLDKVDLHPVGPSTITGQVRLEGESKSKLTDARVIVGQSDGMSFSIEGNSESAEGKIAEDGTFSLHDLSAEIYQVYVSAPGDLYVKSITEDGRDIQDSGIDLKAGAMSATVQIVLSASGGSMEGSVENGAGAKVILIPSDPQAASRLAKTVTAGDDGHFAFTALAPGRYKVFAWEDVDPNAAMYDAEFRKPFESKGQTVEVGEKQKASVQLQLIPRVE